MAHTGHLVMLLFVSYMLKVRASCNISSFYQNIDLNKTGHDLENALRSRLSTTHIFKTYDDAWEILKLADSADGTGLDEEVFLIYQAIAWAADDTSGNGVEGGRWNREHSWPKSYGLGLSGADYTDLHNLRPADSKTNSARNNRVFDWCGIEQGCQVPAYTGMGLDTGRSSDYWMPPAVSRGDLARSVLYMAARYDGSEAYSMELKLTDCPNEANAALAPENRVFMGKLTTLLEWHEQDPPDSKEMYRNHVVCSFQNNRNPFVDFPDLARRVYDPTWFDTGCALGLNNTATPTAQAVLPSEPVIVGQVAIIGFNLDLNSENLKSIAFLALQDLDPGFSFRLTDKAVQQDGISFREGGEGIQEFTASEFKPAGSVWTWPSSEWNPVDGSFSVSKSQDSLVVYSEASIGVPSFIFGLMQGGQGWASLGDSLDSSKSFLPSGLDNASVVLGGLDNYKYVGRTSGFPNDLLEAITDATNWEGHDTDLFTFDQSFQVLHSTLSPSTKIPSRTPTTVTPSLNPTQSLESSTPTCAPSLNPLTKAEPTSCSQTTKQKAIYLNFEYDPPLHALDLSAEVTFRSLSELRAFGARGIFEAYMLKWAKPLGTFTNTPGGYFGPQAFGDASQDKVLFSLWDDGAMTVPMHNNCQRNCQDHVNCNTNSDGSTGTKCTLPFSLVENKPYVLRVWRSEVNTEAFSTTWGMTLNGSVWTASIWDSTSDTASVVIGKILLHNVGESQGITSTSAFHEHIGCTLCGSFTTVVDKAGPWGLGSNLTKITSEYSRDSTCGLQSVTASDFQAETAQIETGSDNELASLSWGKKTVVTCPSLSGCTPRQIPTSGPTSVPTRLPMGPLTGSPTGSPTGLPTWIAPSAKPTGSPTGLPTLVAPSAKPTKARTSSPTRIPSKNLTPAPSSRLISPSFTTSDAPSFQGLLRKTPTWLVLALFSGILAS